MPANPDFAELLSVFNKEHVEYLGVGVHAVGWYCGTNFRRKPSVAHKEAGLQTDDRLSNITENA